MPYVEHPLGRTWFTVRGARRPGRPLVALHGGPGSGSHNMMPYLALSDARPVYVYDQLGCGRSGVTDKRRWTVATFVRELDHLLDAWGLDRFHLLGTSWGATLALEFHLRRRRRRIASLTLQSPMVSAHDWQRDADRLVRALPPEPRKVIRYCHEIGATDARVYRKAMEVFYARHVLRNKRALRNVRRSVNGRKIYAHMWGPSEFQATGTLRDHDRSADLARVSVPTLFVCGEHDEATPRTVRRYAAQVADSRFEVIENASHVITQERPARLMRIVGGFLSEQDG